MSCISGITKLPSTIGLVRKLEELDASGCHDLTDEIPKEIGGHSWLKILNLSNTHILGLPTIISHLSRLQTIDLEPCPELKRIDAPSQQVTPITALPTNIFTLSRLETLTLCCENVEFFPRVSSCLRMLILRFLASAQSPDFSNLKNLSTLTFYGCSIPEFSKVLDLLCMKNLEDICLSNCKLLVKIRGFGKLESLHYLWVEFCNSMKRMLDQSRLREPKKLRV
ncbi:hypothetical protein BT93_L0972 [Corymbia citriodora subsp. variegata]|uniref:Uncharacterized protein n=1 Tax=Corymbia citriodora subsp. variegata TaxID=360336 RepID=A0A8T0CST0_CORYI|nr:hypothetical protein BT93_L0972 [Corymbia citriodora subsp. variegata]